MMTSTNMDTTQYSQRDTKTKKDLSNNSNGFNYKNTKKYLLDLGDGQKVEILYPLIPNSNNPYGVNSTSLKHVFIMVDPRKLSDFPHESLCKSLLGIYPDVVLDVENHELKIIIQGFLPNGPCYRQKRLKIGDLIVSINDFYVNADNIESLLSAIKQPRCIKLTIQSALTFIKLTDITNQSKNSDKSIQAVSKSTDIVKGDRIKEVSTNYDIPHSLMILSFEQDPKNQEKNIPKIDLLYKYPANNDLFVTIRGIFITLAGTIRDIDSSEVKSCKLRLSNQVLNVSFITNSSAILVIAIPEDYIDIYTLKSLTNDLKNVIQFSYGSIKKAFNEKNYKKNFDNLFSLFFQRLLLKNDLINMKSMRYYEDLKIKIFDALPWFELSNTIKVNIDLKLSSFEAQEFVDADGLYYKNRRLFNIIGCCLFYKTYLISTHLNMNQTKNIYKFCDNNGLLILSSNVITNQFYIWKEVFINTSISNNDRNILKHYIIIVGYREFIFVTLVEYGSVSRKIDDETTSIQPDPYLVEQAKSVLNEMMDSGIMRDVNEWYLNISLPTIVSVDKVFNTQKERNINLKNRPRSHLANQYIKDIKLNEKPLKSNSILKKEIKNSTENLNKVYDNLCIFNHFPDSTLYDSVFHYIHSEEKSNGILISPLKHDVEIVDSPLYSNLMKNFSNCCIKIKNLFDMQEKGFNPYIQNNDILEQGILFRIQRTPTTRSRSKSQTDNDNKRSSSVENETNEQNVLNYWVVGKREIKPNKRDFFICFHDSVNDILQEIAFDIGFSRFSF